MKNTKTMTSLFAGLLLGAASLTTITAQAEDNAISANVSIANDYIWRGASQHGEDAELSISGGFDYDSGVGFTAGIWGSNISGASASDTASVEFDFYAAYAGEVSIIGYEVGYIAYTYPNAEDLDFNEIYVGGSYGEFGLTYYLGQQDDPINFIEASYSTSYQGVDFSGTYGSSSESTSDNNDAYTMYGVSAGKSYAGLDFTLGFTSIDFANEGSEDKTNTVLSVGKSF